MKTHYELTGYCPECSKSQNVLTSQILNELQYQKNYYEKMLKDNRPVLKCPDCGAFYESLQVKPILNY